MRKKGKRSHFILRKWHVISVVVCLVVIGYLISSAIPKKQELGFTKNLFRPGEFYGALPNVFNTTISRSENQVEVSVKRDGTSLAFQHPLQQSVIKESKNLIAFSSPNGEITTEYSMRKDGLKEEIILNKIPVENTFPSTLKTDGLITKISSEGIPVFFDKDNNYQFHFERPFVKDSAGNVSYGVRYRIAQETGEEINSFSTTESGITTQKLLAASANLNTKDASSHTNTLIVEVDTTWLHDPKRVLPIIIDPTVVRNTSSQFAAGTSNRTIDSGSGSSPTLETNYQELPADIYTVGLWHMNEASGNILDSSGNSNTGTPTGTTVVAGRLGNGRSFNGSSDVITCTDASCGGITKLDPGTGPLSIEAWVKTTKTTRQIFVGKGIGSGQYAYSLESGTAGIATFYLYNTTDSGFIYASADAVSISDNVWHHVAGVYDGTTVSIYIDGILRGASTTKAGIQVTDSTSNFEIGARNGNTLSFLGTLDEVRISKVARTPAEIESASSHKPYGVYTSDVIDFGSPITFWNSLTWTELGVATGDGETPKSTTGLIAQWNFNETSGASAAQSAGSCGVGCNGTLYNFTNNTSQDILTNSGWTSNNKRWGAGALTFDKTDDNVSTIYTSSQSPTGSNISIETWINPTTIATLDRIMGTASGSVGYRLRIDSTTANNLEFMIGDGATYHSCSKQHGMKPGNWYHVAATYSGAAFNLYVNGKSIGSCADVFTPSWGIGPIAFGGTPEYFGGTIDSTKLYGRVLSPAEIASDYNSSNIEFQTRVGTSTDPNDGSWEAWRPTTSEAVVDNMDNPLDWATPSASIYTAGPTISTSSASFPAIEGTKSLKIKMGSSEPSNATIGLWHMDESGGDLYDSSSNGYILSASGGPTSANGKMGKARTFNGSNQYFLCTDISCGAKLDIGTGAFSIGAWVKTGNYARQIIVGKGSGTGQYSYSLESGVAMDGKLSFYLYNTTDSIYIGINSGYVISDNEWHYVVGSYDGSTLNVYVDGLLGGTTITKAGTQVTDSTSDFQIGARGASSLMFSGIMDEVFVARKGLTYDEVMEGYRAGSDYHIAKTISPLNLSTSSKVPFSIAADRPGTYLEATIGKPFTNYERDGNTVGLWHFDESQIMIPSPPDPIIYNYTGGSQTYVVPNGITSITVKTWGGGGAGGAAGTGGAGGGGAYVNSVLSVTPGETITLYVGGGGSTGSCGAGVGGGAGGGGGYGSGGRGGNAGATGSSCGGGGGGGGSFVLRSSTVLLAAAGGGGGAGAEGGSAGVGGGGGVNGGNGAYGAGGITNASGSVNGTQGADKGAGDASGGGGGGSGYNGGTGGAAASADSLGGGGGAGGASLGTTINNGSGTTPGNSSDTDRGFSGNGGGAYGGGANGRLLIYPNFPTWQTVKDDSGNNNSGSYGAGTSGNVTNTTTLSYTGGNQSYNVPPNVTGIAVKAWGGGGAGGANGTGAAGGGGAYSFSVLPVMPGETITVSVGGGGSTGACGAGTAGGVGGSGGYGTGGRGGAAGSTGSSCSGGGGGAGSFVLRGSTVLLAAAGGGGGAGAEGGSAGPGGGGGVNGGAGAYGAGGTTNANQSVNGAVGGSVGGGDASGGGGAGGGYNGGTGGAAPSGDSLGGGGGAGGASLGVAVLNGSGTTPGNSSDADRGTAGNGGAIYAAGTAGKVVISAVSLKPKQGKMGKAGTFNGTSDYISVPDNSSFDLGTGDFNISFWANHNSLSTYNTYFEMGLYTAGILMRQDTPTTLNIYLQYLTSADVYSYSLAPQLNQWYHFSLNRQGGYLKLYVNGQQIGTTTASSQNIQVSGPLYIGHSAHAAATQYLNGSLDEFVISNTYRSADDIRQAYEIGTRTHKVTIDFGAKLDGGNLIANSSDKLFTVDATYYGLNSKGSNIYLGDKIIVRESYGGVEYIAQGTVNSVVESTGVVTVAAWDGGSTFPIGGFTADASVFKWQKEYFDITGSLGTQRSAISRLSLRPTNGNEGRTIWLDDIRSSGNYLTSPTGSTITSSIGNRYFQYRTILSSFDSAVSATLSAVTIDYSSNNAPNTPSLDLPVDASINQSVTPVFKTTTTDFETNYIRYKILLCTNLAMTTDCQTFDQTSTQTGWTGQDTQMGTAYVSGTQATYTIATELNPSTTYYWRSYAIDPAGSGNWSTTQAVPKSFTTTSAPSSPTSLQAQGLTNPTVSTLTPYFSALHNDPVGNAANKYQVQVNTNNTFTGTTMWDSGQVSMATTASGARIPNVTYAGTSLVFNGTTYYWRIRLTNILNATGTWSSPASFKLSTPPNTPVLDLPSNTAIDVTVQPMLRITATDVDSDYLQYKIQICTNLAMTSNCLVFDQTSSQTGWSGQDAQTGTAYVSGTQASFTPSSPLSIVTAYYWRSYAIDPGGSNVWSGTQSNIYSFTTTNAPLYGTGCVVRESNNDSSLLVRWSDNAFDENGYEVRRSVDGGAYVELATNIPPNSTSYQDISITTGHTYSYQIAPYFTAGPTYGTWCTTVPLSIQRGTFTIKGVKLN